jgi:hypothetical protein
LTSIIPSASAIDHLLRFLGERAQASVREPSHVTGHRSTNFSGVLPVTPASAPIAAAAAASISASGPEAEIDAAAEAATAALRAVQGQEVQKFVDK